MSCFTGTEGFSQTALVPLCMPQQIDRRPTHIYHTDFFTIFNLQSLNVFYTLFFEVQMTAPYCAMGIAG
jgi:hypothetical protein